MLLPQRLEPLAERPKARIVQMLAEAAGDLDLYLLRLPVGIWRAEHRFQQVRVEHELLQIIADGVDVHVAVDEIDGLRAEGVPE